jgi:hypothetical protein
LRGTSAQATVKVTHIGLAAIMAVVLTILMWGRIFAPPAMLQALIMAGATCVLVVGYSFEDT